MVAIVPAEAFLAVYALVPADLQFLLPGRAVLIPALACLAFLARITRQA